MFDRVSSQTQASVENSRAVEKLCEVQLVLINLQKCHIFKCFPGVCFLKCTFLITEMSVPVSVICLKGFLIQTVLEGNC